MKLKQTLKKFTRNKNAVTIVGALAILMVLMLGYNYRINQVTQPIKVLVAAEEIPARTQITADMLKQIEVPPALIRDNVLTSTKDIIGMYTAFDTTVSENSLFYEGMLLDSDELPNASITDLDEDELAYNLMVDMETSYANSIVPDSYVDIYFKAVDETGSPIVGKLVENVKILAIKDSSGDNVFQSADSGNPYMYIFAVTEDIHILLRQSEYLEGYDTALIPVPTGKVYEGTEADVQIASQFIKNWIMSKAVPIPEDIVVEIDETTDDETTTEEETDTTTDETDTTEETTEEEN